jgi:hypothetical protein
VQWFRNRSIALRPVVVAAAADGSVIAWASFTNFKVRNIQQRVLSQ